MRPHNVDFKQGKTKVSQTVQYNMAGYIPSKQFYDAARSLGLRRFNLGLEHNYIHYTQEELRVHETSSAQLDEPPKKFLDLIAELLTPIQTGGSKEVVAVAFTRDHKDKPHLYFAQNNGFSGYSDRFKMFVRKLQTWIRKLAGSPSRDECAWGEFWEQVVRYSAPGLRKHLNLVKIADRNLLPSLFPEESDCANAELLWNES